MSRCSKPCPQVHANSNDQDLDSLEVTPPLAIQDHGQILREIMVVYESSLLEGETLEQQASGAKQILDSIVNPAIEMCLTASEEKHKLKPKWDYRVFALNCLTYVKVWLNVPLCRKVNITILIERDRTVRVHEGKAGGD